MGSIRRECLDHLLIFDEAQPRRILGPYFDYYRRARTHLSLARNASEAREIKPSLRGKTVAIPHVGGLHQRYTRGAQLLEP